MKKQSKLAVFMAMLLGATTVLSACNGSGSYNPEWDKPSGDPPEETPIYKDLAAEWAKYLEYVSDEEAATVAKANAITQKETDKLSASIQETDYSYSVKTEVKQYDVFEKDEPVINPETGAQETDGEGNPLTQKVDYEAQIGTTTEETITFNGGKTLKLSQVEYEFVGGKLLVASAKNETTKKITDIKKVSYSVAGNGLFEVVTTSYKLKTPEAPAEGEEPVVLDETLLSNYDEVVTYSYYDKFGNELAKNLSEEVTTRFADSITQTIVDIANKTYLIDKGEVIKTFDLGMEHGIPTLDKESKQIEGNSFDASKYAYYAQNGYEYTVQDATPQTMIVGELAMMVFPAVTIGAYKDNEFVAQYKAEADSIMGYAVLPNGSLYVCEYEYLPAASETYDVMSGEQKLNVNHVIIDVVTGAKTSVDQAFVATKVFTNSTTEIATYMNAVTVGTNGMYNNMKVKDGYVLAEIQKISNQAIEGNTVFAVLNEQTMEIVAELPKIVPNQFGYASFIDGDHMLVQARTTENSILNYTVEVSTGNLELFLHNISRAKVFDGGFLLNNKVYDYDWKLLKDYSEEMTSYEGDKITVWNGKLLIWDKDASTYDTYTSYSFYLTYAYIGTYRDWLIQNGQSTEWYEDKELAEPRYIEKSIFSHGSVSSNESEYTYESYGNVLAVTRATGMTRLYDINGDEIVIVKDENGNAADFSGKSVYSNVYEKYENGEINYSKYVQFNVDTTVEIVAQTEGGLLVKTREYWHEIQAYGTRYGYNYGESPSAEVLAWEGKVYEQFYLVK